MKLKKFAPPLIALALLLLGSRVLAAPVQVGQTAPAFNLTTLSGVHLNSNQLLGKKPIYLKFWATWCSYCLAEMPHLQEVENSYGDKIQIIAIDVGINDSIANINTLFSKNNYQLPVVFDQQGDMVARYGVIGTPNHVLIDKQGKVVYRTFLATDALDQQLAKLAQE